MNNSRIEMVMAWAVIDWMVRWIWLPSASSTSSLLSHLSTSPAHQTPLSCESDPRYCNAARRSSGLRPPSPSRLAERENCPENANIARKRCSFVVFLNVFGGLTRFCVFRVFYLYVLSSSMSLSSQERDSWIFGRFSPLSIGSALSQVN